MASDTFSHDLAHIEKEKLRIQGGVSNNCHKSLYFSLHILSISSLHVKQMFRLGENHCRTLLYSTICVLNLSKKNCMYCKFSVTVNIGIPQLWHALLCVYNPLHIHGHQIIQTWSSCVPITCSSILCLSVSVLIIPHFKPLFPFILSTTSEHHLPPLYHLHPNLRNDLPFFLLILRIWDRLL